MKNFLGIDPGQSGAMALITPEQTLICDWVDGPTMAATLINWKLIYKIDIATLEQVHAMPGQGVSSMFKFGANFGWWQGALEALGIPYDLVRPQRWQKGVVPKKESKSDKPSLLVARRLFPDAELHLKKHHGRADALLIADYQRKLRTAF